MRLACLKLLRLPRAYLLNYLCFLKVPECHTGLLVTLVTFYDDMILIFFLMFLHHTNNSKPALLFQLCNWTKIHMYNKKCIVT